MLFVSVLIAYRAVAADYVISVNESYGHKVGKQNIVSLFNEIYAPLGISPTFEYLPSLRSLQLVNEGTIDAEAGRASSIANNYKNIIQVAYPIIKSEVGYICLNADLCKLDPKLRYAVVSGLERVKKFCKEKKLNCLFDESQSFLAKAMLNNAVDALIGSVATATDILCLLGSQKVFYKTNSKMSITSYHLIHKKHAELLPELNKSIRSLVEKGRIAEFIALTSDINSTCKIDLQRL
jgi:hypothetical protein